MKKTDHKMHPETHMTSLGYDPFLSEGSVKSPIFQTSTFAFKSAAEGKAFFELAYGLRDAKDGEQLGLIYSRLNNPNLQILEERLAVWDGADDCAVFESGMAAISTVLLEFLKPGDLFLFGNPVYGGTSHFINHILTQFGVHVVSFTAENTKEELLDLVKKTGLQDKLKAIYVETPGNPTNAIIDIEMVKEIAEYFSTEEYKVPLVVDNTFLGPVFQHPMDHGADLVVYSATKYIGGHSDIIAGVVSGKADLMARVKGLRTFLGNMASPWISWLLMRSLETLKIRMEKQSFNAQKIAEHLVGHPKIERVSYLGLLEEGTRQKEIFDKQCVGSGGMLSFYIKGGEEEAFKFIDSLVIPKVAVSLGSTESLVEHPATMTHAEIPYEEKQYLGITENLVRLSVGVENHEDLIWDIEQALDKI
ncbi:MAG TPA: cystathionine gamma-synthase family protein [Bacteroidetes bacterium]|nr:cystathionine gamma-synthase family protein [Bacteroidota bacterium]